MFGYGYSFGPAVRQRITMQQVQEIALRNVPGQVIHANMDMENGILIYEIFILTPQNRIYEVEVAARNGRILKIEEENEFD